jgi:hypothetical protein
MPNTSKTNNSVPLSYQRGALGRFSFCKIQVAKQAQVRPTYTNPVYLRQSGAIACFFEFVFKFIAKIIYFNENSCNFVS